MKRLFLPTSLILALTLAACSALPSAAPTPLPTLVLGAPTPGDSNPDAIAASAEIVPIRVAQLSPAAIGRVQTVDVKAGDKVTAGQSLVTFDTALLEARVREAKTNWDAADIQLRFLQRVGTAEQNLESAKADLERAQALLDSAKAALETQSALLAPFDATVVAVDAAAGETAIPGRVIVTLGDLSKFQVRTTDLSERNVTRVQVGQVVEIAVPALGQTFEGRVASVALVSSALGGDVVFAVVIDFVKQPEGLRWGMSADVKIQAK